MAEYKDLIKETNDIPDDKLLSYFTDFFRAENYQDYSSIEEPTGKQEQALAVLFEEDKELADRVGEALALDPFCIEALFIDLCMAPPVYIYRNFNDLFVRKEQYESFDKRQKSCFLAAMVMFVDFLFEIANIHKALSVLTAYCATVGEYSSNSLIRFGYLYTSLEDAESFFDMYHNFEFDEPVLYILLLIVLLKNERQAEAQEVYLDFMEVFPYAEKLGSIYELDGNSDEEAMRMVAAYDACDTIVASLPYFGEWCRLNSVQKKSFA